MPAQTVTPAQVSKIDNWDYTLNQWISNVTGSIGLLQSQVSALQAQVLTLTGSTPAGTITPGTSQEFSTTASATTITGSITVGAGVTCLYVEVGYGNTASAPNQVTGVTYGVAALTKISTSTSSTSSTGRGTDHWYLMAPSVGTAAVTVTMAASQFGVMTVTPLTSSTGALSFSTVGSDGGTAAATSSCSAGSGANLYLGSTLARTVSTITIGGSDVALLSPAVTNSTMSWAAIKSTDVTLATSWTQSPTQEYASLIVGVIAGASSSSAPTIPTGSVTSNGKTWSLIYSEDFNTTAAVGAFTNVNQSGSALSAPAAYTGSLGAYPKSYGDTSGRGYYDPQRTMSVSGGSLHVDMDYNAAGINPKTGATGAYAVCAPSPKLPTMTGGRLSAAFRCTHGSNTYKVAWLWWPDSNVWPAGGEIDFLECNLTSKIGAFAHWASASGGQDAMSTNTFINDGAWHTITVEWVASTSIRIYLDGVLEGTSTTLVPPGPMHAVLQCETNIGGTVSTADTASLEVAWIVAYN